MHAFSSLSEMLFARLARLRRARALHPRGSVAQATWTVDDTASVLGTAFGTGSQSVVVRLSRGLGAPPPLPDVHGVAVRLDVGGRPVDLLLSGTTRRMSTLLPYRSERGLVLLGLRRRSESSFELREWPVPGAPRTVGWLEVGEPTGDDGAPYDPYVHQHPALRPVAFLSRVREAAYDGSRRGRSD